MPANAAKNAILSEATRKIYSAPPYGSMSGISIDPNCKYGKKGTPWEKVVFKSLPPHDMYQEKVDNR